MYDAISQVTELEEKVYVEFKVEDVVLFSIWVKMFVLSFHVLTHGPPIFQKVNEFVTAMEQTSYNIKAELPGLLDHSRKLLGLYKTLFTLVFLSID